MDCVRLLIAKGADLNVQDRDRWTALHWAAHKGHADVVELLIANGADLTLRKKVGLSCVCAVLSVPLTSPSLALPSCTERHGLRLRLQRRHPRSVPAAASFFLHRPCHLSASERERGGPYRRDRQQH